MTSTRAKFLLLGDSLTQLGWDGWAGKLAHTYQRRVDVVNRGMAGYNTKWFLTYAKESDVWTVENVKLVSIFFGANDASDPVLNPRHHVSVPEFSKNLETIILSCRESYGKDVAIVVIAAPPVVHAQRFEWQKQRYGSKATGQLERNMELSKAYAQAAMDIADIHKVAGVHLWTLMQEAPDWESFFYDGLHFTRKGNDFVANAVLQKITEVYPTLAVTPCKITQQWGNSGSVCPELMHDGPFHDQIDHSHHEAAFQEYSIKRGKNDEV